MAAAEDEGVLAGVLLALLTLLLDPREEASDDVRAVLRLEELLHSLLLLFCRLLGDDVGDEDDSTWWWLWACD